MEGQDPEDQEEALTYYVEQDDLETVKLWLEDIREKRIEEAERLEVELEEAEADIKDFEEDLESIREWKPKRHIESMNGEVKENEMDIERYRRMLRDKRDFALRRLRDLVRQERDDLEWIWKLERREREATEAYRPTTKKEHRAADWKARQKGNQ